MKNDEMPIHQKAHMDTLHALRKMAMDMIRERSGESGEDDADGMSKVMVAAKDKAGLKKGLEKASSVLDQLPDHELNAEDDGKHDLEDSLMDHEDHDEDAEDEDHDEDHDSEDEDHENSHDMMGHHSMADEEELHLDPSRHAEAVDEEAHESPEEQEAEEQDLLRKLQELRARKRMV